VKKGQSIKVFSELRDLEIFDSQGQLCGVADDIEFEGAVGQDMMVKAILVGPGAFAGRIPRWAVSLIHLVAGRKVTQVPWSAVEHVTSRITLNRTAEDLDLNAVERRLQPLVARLPPC
jgi:sporulation protein YlmC with PRC-barrel domain